MLVSSLKVYHSAQCLFPSKNVKTNGSNEEPDSRYKVAETRAHGETGRAALETDAIASYEEPSCRNYKEDTTTQMELG